MREYRQSNEGEARAADRFRESDRFLTAWWSHTAPSLREVVREWQQSDRTLADKHQAEQEQIERARRHDEVHRRLLGDLDWLHRAGDDIGAYEACRKFLQEFSDSVHAVPVRAGQERAREAWDKRAWAELQDYEGRFAKTGNLQAILKRIRDYLKIPAGVNRTDALRLLGRYEELWDREEYAELQALAQKGMDGRDLEAVQRKAGEYLSAQRSIRVMASAATAWRDWFLGLQEERPYTIRVKSVSVPRRSSLDSVWGVDARVTLTLGEETRASAAYEGRSPTMNADIGPFPFRWGKPTRLVVRVENYFPLIANPVIETVVEDERFVLGRANGAVTITCLKGKQVTVHLECPAATPPVLPAYGTK